MLWDVFGDVNVMQDSIGENGRLVRKFMKK